MRAAILKALKRRRSDDQGFSLIELIVVVAILGILVAIAIPVFSGIQDTAKANALKTAAANGATVVASQVAQGVTATADVQAELTLSNTDDYTLTLSAPASGTAVTVSNFCVTAAAAGSLAGTANVTNGPGCP